MSKILSTFHAVILGIIFFVLNQLTKTLNNLFFRLSNQHSSTEKLEAISDKLEIKEIESKKLIFQLENGIQQGKIIIKLCNAFKYFAILF